MTTRQEIKIIRQAIAEGKTDEEVYAVIRNHIETRRQNAWDKVGEVYKQTGSMQRAAEQLGVTIQSVKRWLTVQGVKINKRGGQQYWAIPPEVTQKVIELSKQGMTANDIQAATGVSKATVYNIRKRNGICQKQKPTAEQLERVKTYKGRTMNPTVVAKICGVTRYQVLKCWYN